MVVAGLAGGCACIARPSEGWVLGEEPPVARDAESLRGALLDHPGPEVDWLANMLGCVTTPLFKNNGIQGWNMMGIDAAMVGAVEREPVLSTDRFLTVDVRLREVTFGVTRFEISDCTRFLRAEVCTCFVDMSEGNRPVLGDVVEIRGELRWDRDGFLEIHPRGATDVVVLTRGHQQPAEAGQ